MIDLSEKNYQWLVELDCYNQNDWENIKATWKCVADSGGSEYVYLDDVIRVQANFWDAHVQVPDDYDNLHVAAVAANADNPWTKIEHVGDSAIEDITNATAATLLKGITMDPNVQEGCFFTGADYATAQVDTDANYDVTRIAYWQFKFNPSSELTDTDWQLCFAFGDPHVGKTKHKYKSTEKRPKKKKPKGS